MWTVFPVHEAHQAEQGMCEGIALKSVLGSAGHLFSKQTLPLTEFSHICTASDTTLSQLHSAHVFSPVYTVLQAAFLLPQTRGSFHFTKAHCHGCRFLLLTAGVMSICTALLEVLLSLQYRPSAIPVLPPHCTFFGDYFLVPSVLCRVYPTCHRARTHSVLPQDILATLVSFIFSDLFLDVLRTSESLMGKKPSSAPCTYVGFLSCCT